MKRVKHFLGIFSMLVMLFAFSTTVFAIEHVTCDVQCPEFALIDTDENIITNTSLRGKPTIMVFAADYCIFGKNTIKGIGRSDWYQDGKVNVIFGMLDGTKEATKAYQDTYGYEGMRFCYAEENGDVFGTFKEMFNLTGGVAESGEYAIPQIFLMDSNGKIFLRWQGVFEEDQISSYLDKYVDLSYPASSVQVLSGNLKTYEYTGKAIEPYVAIGKGNAGLISGYHYTTTYESNVNAGTGYVVLTGKKYMKGSVRVPFTITPQSISEAYVTDVASQSYTGSAVTPGVKANWNGYDLVAGKDYTLSYANNINCGQATVIITGKGNYTGTLKKMFTIEKADLTDDCVDPIKAQKFTGKAIKPKVTVRYAGKVLVKNRDYTVSYYDNVKSADAYAVITGKGNYEGTVYAPFTIKSVGKFNVSGNKYKIKSYSSKTVYYVGSTDKNKKSITVPSTVTYYGKKYTVTDIASKAFANYKKLQKVTISKNVTKIGSKAFYNCSKLKTITVKSTKLKSVGSNALKGIHKNCKIKVPSKKYKAYKTLFKGKGQKKTVKVKK